MQRQEVSNEKKGTNITHYLIHNEGLITTRAAQRVAEQTKVWKKTLRSAKKTHTIQRMEAASDEVWSMDEINALLNNAGRTCEKEIKSQ